MLIFFLAQYSKSPDQLFAKLLNNQPQIGHTNEATIKETPQSHSRSTSNLLKPWKNLKRGLKFQLQTAKDQDARILAMDVVKDIVMAVSKLYLDNRSYFINLFPKLCLRFYEYLIVENSLYDKHWSSSGGIYRGRWENHPLHVEKKFVKIHFIYYWIIQLRYNGIIIIINLLTETLGQYTAVLWQKEASRISKKLRKMLKRVFLSTQNNTCFFLP